MMQQTAVAACKALILTLLLNQISVASDPAVPVSPQAAGAAVERVGPPTFYAPPVERYRLGEPDVRSASFYPIPQSAVTRDTYMAWLELSGLLDYAQQPELGMNGPTLLLPVLAKFVQSGERHWGEACIVMLKDYHRAIKDEVQAKGWVEQFAEPPAFLPIYRKYLMAGGLMNGDETWFKQLWLDYCRHLHVWGTKPIEWQRLHTTQVLYPHAARKAPPVSNNPGISHDNRAAELAILSGASAIQVHRDDLNATILRCEFVPGRVEWIVFNPNNESIELDFGKTTEALAYFDDAHE